MGLLVNATVHGYRSVYCKIWVLMNAFRQRFALNAQIVNSANSVHRGRQICYRFLSAPIWRSIYSAGMITTGVNQELKEQESV